MTPRQKTPVKLEPWYHTAIQAAAEKYGITKTNALECIIAHLKTEGIEAILAIYYAKKEATS